MSDLSHLKVPEQDRPTDMPDDERLRWVRGFQGDYAISDKGRLFSYKRSYVSDGSEPHEMSDALNSRGYPTASLYKDGEEHSVKVHRLVLIMFHREPKENEECRHLNGKHADNRLENLAWGTHKENMRDIIWNGKRDLSPADARKIKKLCENTELDRQQIAKDFSVSKSVVGGISKSSTYKEALRISEADVDLSPDTVRKAADGEQEAVASLTSGEGNAELLASALMEACDHERFDVLTALASANRKQGATQ